MTIKGRVGLHAMSGGRQCQNWSSDQQVIIDLLNRIPFAEGGTQGTLKGPIISGIASKPLSDAILTFERHSFHGQHSGFVDPNGPMLRRMEEVAGRTSHPAAAPSESNLLILRRNLLDDALATKLDPYWAMHKVWFQPLIRMAQKHIDNLIEMNLTELPWPAELFGRAFVLKHGEILMHFPTFKSSAKRLFGGNGESPLFLYDDKGGSTEDPDLPEMSYGKPVDVARRIFTKGLPAILLYQAGGVARLAPYQWGPIEYLGATSSRDRNTAPEYWSS